MQQASNTTKHVYDDQKDSSFIIFCVLDSRRVLTWQNEILNWLVILSNSYLIISEHPLACYQDAGQHEIKITQKTSASLLLNMKINALYCTD